MRKDPPQIKTQTPQNLKWIFSFLFIFIQFRFRIRRAVTVCHTIQLFMSRPDLCQFGFSRFSRLGLLERR